MPFADLTDVRCRYEIMGTGDPLVMIPGLGSTCERWGPVTEKLAQSFTLILPDNRDSGKSIAKRRARTLADLAADIVELLDHLQLEKAHILGLSFGGIIAQRFAIDHPSGVDRLVLVSCASRFGPYTCQITSLLEQTLRRFPFEMFRRTMEVLGTSPEYFDAHSEEISRKILGCGDSGEDRQATVRQLSCLGFQGVAPPEEYHIHSPTLVIAGEQDLLIPRSYARKMADEIPGSEFMSIPSCGHNPLVEQPDVAIPRIIEFLSGVQLANSHDHGWAARLSHQAVPVMEEVN